MVAGGVKPGKSTVFLRNEFTQSNIIFPKESEPHKYFSSQRKKYGTNQKGTLVSPGAHWFPQSPTIVRITHTTKLPLIISNIFQYTI